MEKTFKISLCHKSKINKIDNYVYGIAALIFICTQFYIIPSYIRYHPKDIYIKIVIGDLTSILLVILAFVIQNFRHYDPAILNLNLDRLLIRNEKTFEIKHDQIKDIINPRPSSITKKVRFLIITNDNKEIEIKADRELYNILEDLYID